MNEAGHRSRQKKKEEKKKAGGLGGLGGSTALGGWGGLTSEARPPRSEAHMPGMRTATVTFSSGCSTTASLVVFTVPAAAMVWPPKTTNLWSSGR